MVKKSSSSKSTKSNSNSFPIKFLRLTNGEDIVTEVIDESYGKFTISNPLKIVYSTSMRPGYLTMSLMQWVFLRLSKNQTFQISETNVLLSSLPDKGLLDHYHSSVEALTEKGNSNFEFANNTDESDVGLDEDMENLDELDGLELLENLMNRMKKNKGSLH